jgi:hypothetical protein
MRDESDHENRGDDLRFVDLAAVFAFLVLVVGAYAAMISDLENATLILGSRIVANQSVRSP